MKETQITPDKKQVELIRPSYTPPVKQEKVSPSTPQLNSRTNLQSINPLKVINKWNQELKSAEANNLDQEIISFIESEDFNNIIFPGTILNENTNQEIQVGQIEFLNLMAQSIRNTRNENKQENSELVEYLNDRLTNDGEFRTKTIKYLELALDAAAKLNLSRRRDPAQRQLDAEGLGYRDSKLSQHAIENFGYLFNRLI